MDKEAEELKQMRMVLAAVAMHAMLNRVSQGMEVDLLAVTSFQVADAMIAAEEQTS